MRGSPPAADAPCPYSTGKAKSNCQPSRHAILINMATAQPSEYCCVATLSLPWDVKSPRLRQALDNPRREDLPSARVAVPPLPLDGERPANTLHVHGSTRSREITALITGKTPGPHLGFRSAGSRFQLNTTSKSLRIATGMEGHAPSCPAGAIAAPTERRPPRGRHGFTSSGAAGETLAEIMQLNRRRPRSSCTVR